MLLLSFLLFSSLCLPHINLVGCTTAVALMQRTRGPKAPIRSKAEPLICPTSSWQGFFLSAAPPAEAHPRNLVVKKKTFVLRILFPASVLHVSEDFSLLVAFLLVTFSWLFRGFFVALVCLEKQCSGLFRYFFVVFSWLFRGFFMAPVLGKFYAYSPWNSLLNTCRASR